MPLEVIGAGFGRTGTNSLKLALEALGFGPCHHMHEVSHHPEQAAPWLAAAEGAPVDWEALFAGYRSQVDWPGARWWRELADAFPAAKVILTLRPAEDWYASFAATVAPEICRPPSGPSQAAADRRRMQRLTIGEQVFAGKADDRDAALATYRRHAEAVRAAIAPGRLLVFDVAEGWAPLCGFLGVPVPDAPFPRTNSKAEFHAGTWTRPGPAR